MSRELRSLGLRKLSARPRHHAQNEFALEAYKKTAHQEIEWMNLMGNAA
jgi:hypothetical protein